MTGIPNVNNIFFIYHLATLLFLFLIALYDARYHKICNQALLAFLLWCLFSFPVTVFAYASVPWHRYLFSRFLGSFAGFFMLLLIAIATDGGIGGGDIKLVGVLGLLYGLSGLLSVLVTACAATLLHYFYFFS